MSVESTRKTILGYLNAQHADTHLLAEDVTFTVMGTGQVDRGPQAVQGTLNYLYHIAFDASVDTQLMLFGENNAVLEGFFVGKHTGEFAGIPATSKDVRVPMCIVYDVANEQIQHARIYFEMPVLLAQLGVPMGAPS